MGHSGSEVYLASPAVAAASAIAGAICDPAKIADPAGGRAAARAPAGAGRGGER